MRNTFTCAGDEVPAVAEPTVKINRIRKANIFQLAKWSRRCAHKIARMDKLIRKSRLPRVAFLLGRRKEALEIWADAIAQEVRTRVAPGTVTEG